MLSDGLEDARGRDGSLLAPKHFAATEVELEHAIEHARVADRARAEAAAQRGLKGLTALNSAISKNQKYMEEVVALRARARKQGAETFFEPEFERVDKKLRTASRMLEEEQFERADRQRPELIRAYAALELKGLKKGTVAKAEEAISSAEKAGARKLAPKTLQNARAELKLAISVLDADRTQLDKSNAYATKATWLAHRSREIANLVKHFQSQNFTNEERVLWYQDQLQRVRRAVRKDPLPFDQANAKVVQALRDDVLALHSVLQDTQGTNNSFQRRVSQLEQDLEAQRKRHDSEMEQLLQDHQQQLAANIEAREQQLAALDSGNRAQLVRAQLKAEAQIKKLKKQQTDQVRELEQRLSAEAQARAEAAERERRHQARFEQTRQFFAASDAEVFRQGDDVLIRLKGIYFRPGSHELEARNYGLLNNVMAAINVFPKATVKIIGHTDARGSASRNLGVSLARAQSVVRFLSTVGGIKADRLIAEGRGEEEPLATNETPDGRSQNRRIDVLIVNTIQPSPVASRAK
jgi:outer membrane protein OmpA-like peptidoglycan-associated protein